MRLPIVCVVAGAVMLATPAAQNARPAVATGSISGCVVDGGTGRPVAGAHVSGYQIPDTTDLLPADRSQESMVVFDGALFQQLMTDANGAFVAEGLPPGKYEVRASKSGWTQGMYGQRGPDETSHWVVVGAHRTAGINVPLWKQGTVGGRVVNDDGVPMPGVQVGAIAREGNRESFEAETTDDRGMFLIAVEPGEYLVAAGVVRQYGSVTMPKAKSRAGRSRAYEQTFFGQSTSAATATAVRVGPGEDRANIDIRMTAMPAFRITGLAAGSSTAEAAGISLIRTDGAHESWRRHIAETMADAQGRFEFSGIPPGDYELKVAKYPELPIAYHGIASLRHLPEAPTLWAEQRLSIADRDLDVRLDLRTGARITGQVIFAGTTEPPPLEVLRNYALVVEQPSTNAHLLGSYVSAGHFATIQLPVGRYYVRPIPPPGWHLRSVISSNRDIRDAPVDLASSDVSDAVITFTDRSSTLSGRVLRQPPFDTTRGWISIFPADRSFWPLLNRSPRRFIAATIGGSGTFRAAVPAGSYYVIATDVEIDFSSLAALERLAGLATLVPIGEGLAAVSPDLRIQRVRR